MCGNMTCWFENNGTFKVSIITNVVLAEVVFGRVTKKGAQTAFTCKLMGIKTRVLLQITILYPEHFESCFKSIN